MRCKECGGMLHHYAIADGGQNYYQCHTGLTSFRKDARGIVNRETQIIPCAIVHNSNGDVLPVGKVISYLSEGKYHTKQVNI